MQGPTGDRVQVEILDVSVGGVFVGTEKPVLPFRSKVSLVMKLAHDRRLRLVGEIVHIAPPELSRQQGQPSGYGIQLIEPPDNLVRLLSDEDLHTGASEPAPPGASSDPRRVPVALIVDDDQRVGLALLRVMAQLEIPAVWVDGGGRARKKFEESPQTWELIFVDTLLPDSSGEELVREFRKETQAGIIAMSGVVRSDRARRDLLAAGADDFLSKPFLFQDVSQAVRKLVSPNKTAAKRSAA